MIGLFMLVIGLMDILIPKTEWYKKSFYNLDDGIGYKYIGYIRKILGIILILIGICMLLYNILLITK